MDQVIQQQEAAAAAAPAAGTQERIRLDVLRSYGILGTPAEPDFDRLVHLAGLICQAPMALLSFVDADEVWCKSALGLGQRRLQRETALCDHVVRAGTGLVVGDAMRDPRFRGNPLVRSAPALRAYAGMPLTAPSGYVLGVLAVADYTPRLFDEVQTQALRSLAGQVMAQLELRRLQMLKTAEAGIMAQIAAEAPLEQVLASIARMVCGHDPRFGCALMLADDSRLRLRLTMSRGLPPALAAVLDGVAIGPGAGSCARAAAERRSAVARDIATNPDWAPLGQPALAYGLRACWSMPVLAADGEVLGTVALYAHAAGEPGADEWELMRSCAQLAGVAVERARAARALRRQATLLDQARDSIVVYGVDGRISYWNKGAERLHGWTAAEMLGRPATTILDDRRLDPARLRRALRQHGEWLGEITLRHKSGRTIAVECRKTLVRDERGRAQAVFSICTDVTERKRAEERMHHMASHDQLTQLPNRRHMVERLKQAQARSGAAGATGALLFIDLDNFKSLNDTLGHRYGDLVLQQVAERLRICVREGDLVARFGGDEFVLLLEHLGSGDEEAARQTETAAGRVLEALNRPYRIMGQQYSSAASVGIALFRGLDPAPEELIKQAELAMYQAKSAGRNTMRLFTPEMQAKANARSAIEKDMRAGLDGGEFSLDYQPQVDRAGRIVGAEGLMRWRHARLGVISPAEFIPVAEETGMIHALGRLALQAAMLQLRAWRDDPALAGLTLAVNVSARQFHEPGFVGDVLDLLAQTGAPARLLKIELTESSLVRSVDDTIARMLELKRHGIRFSLDDFGTGYSSLSYLKRFPLDQIKIDQSFIQDALDDQDSIAIVATIITLGHTLQMEVIAEGVETERHRQMLADLGCEMYQGYLFSRPLPPAQLETLLRMQHLDSSAGIGAGCRPTSATTATTATTVATVAPAAPSTEDEAT